MTTIDDQIYIDKILNGDTNAFAILVDRYKDLVFTLALRMLKNKEEAEEVSQDTFIKTYKSLNRFKGNSKFSTWIYRVAYNTCLDRLKKNKRKQNTVAIDEYTEHQVKTIDNALDRIETQEKQQAIKNCLELLPSEDSFLLTLYYFEEQSLDEIAKVVNLTPNNVKVKLFRSRKKLATILKQQLDNETIESYAGQYRAAFR
ncbi:sigma-70 family RNA polymerase sigma factor [Flavobacteriaceae bacterium AU392]|nr:sigma-70 family RNA polymerase sigma factor [Flavobacteriaceae bacterium]RKM81125.1 sigma-70 family RNA polymerase sigma factor [Flavobacteriaceae bacterium AU392]